MSSFTPSCSASEYSSLLSTASTLTLPLARSELLECARYGETDCVQAILSVHPALIDSTDSQGSTCLHKACANGNSEMVDLLISNRASHVKNANGNFPLHWAAAGGHIECVRSLLSGFDSIDVLAKNEFGRSALTEGFSSETTEVVGQLLEHDSATEEKLLGGTGGEEVGKKHGGVVHDFNLGPGTRELSIRELPIAHADDPFGSKAEDDTTGLGIWCASIVMARWMASPQISKRFENKTILELGAGCGVPGLAAALYGNPSLVHLTDINPHTIKNLQHNITINTEPDSPLHKKTILAKTLDWGNESTYPDTKFDFIIGADLIYQSSIVPLFQSVLEALLSPTGTFLYCCPEGGRDGLEDFRASMKEHDFDFVGETNAPMEWKENPLVSQDSTDCFLHFGELKSTEYILYEFRKNKKL